MIQQVKLGHGIPKIVGISLNTLLKGCIEELNETQKIKDQFRKEFPGLDL